MLGLRVDRQLGYCRSSAARGTVKSHLVFRHENFLRFDIGSSAVVVLGNIVMARGAADILEDTLRYPDWLDDYLRDLRDSFSELSCIFVVSCESVSVISK
jgi:hypothetical protein